MIVKTYELQKIKSTNLNFFLLYGSNEGFKEQVIIEYFIKDFEGDIQRYEDTEILSNYQNFISNLLNVSPDGVVYNVGFFFIFFLFFD